MYRSCILILGLIAILCCLSCTAEASVVITKPVSTDGLVGYWKFDEVSGTTAIDSSGGDNTATLENGATRAAGKFGRALQLDGSNDYVSISEAYESSDATWSAWVKLNNFNQSGGYAPHILYQADGSGNHETRISIGVDGTVTWLVYDLSYNCNISSNNKLVVGQWAQITASYGTGGCKLYINGVLEASNPSTGGPGTGAVRFVIGRLDVNGTGYVNGSIDEVRMYDRVLSAEEVVQLYTQKFPIQLNTQPQVREPDHFVAQEEWVSCASEGWYCSFSGTRQVRYGANDVYAYGTYDGGVGCDNGVFGDPIGGVSKQCWYAQDAGLVATSSLIAHYTFDGKDVNGDVVRDISGQKNNGTRKPELYGPGGDGWAISNASYYPEFNGDYFVCDECGTSYGKPIYKMGDYWLLYEQMEWYDDWYNETYVDTYWYLSYGDMWNVYYMGWASHTIGDGYEYGAPCDWPDAPACYWDDGLTATELVTSGPVLGGTNKWATPGKMGQAMKFNGVDEYVSIPNQDRNTFSVSLWLKRDRLGAEWGSFGCNPSCDRLIGGNTNGWGISFDSDDTLFLTKIGVSGVNSSAQIADMTTWHYVTVTYDGSTARFYIDGVLKDTKSYATTFSSSGNYAIGTLTNSLNQYFSGLMDDVRIYSKVLTDTEVQDLYKKTNNNKVVINTNQNNKNTNGLVGLWSFNGPDISGTTAYDRSGQGNDGTLINGPKPAIGKVGQALKFDGVDDVIIVEDSSSLQIAGDITVATWVKTNSATNQNLVMKYGGPDSGWLLYLLDTGKIVFDGRDGSGNYRSSGQSTQIVNDNKWHYIVGQRRGSTWLVYIDGVLGSSANVGTSGSIANVGKDIYIGAWDDSSQLVNGSLDEVRIYNRALSAQEIKQLYTGGK